jgi:hypothetical protein
MGTPAALDVSDQVLSLMDLSRATEKLTAMRDQLLSTARDVFLREASTCTLTRELQHRTAEARLALRQSASSHVPSHVPRSEFFAMSLSDEAPMWNRNSAAYAHALNAMVDDDDDYEGTDMILLSCDEAFDGEQIIPKKHRDICTFSEAERKRWEEAEDVEIQSFKKHGVLELVSDTEVARLRRDKVTILCAKWVYSFKHDEHGNVIKYKARVVARGDMQKDGRDFYGAPVLPISSMRATLAQGNDEDDEMDQMDISTAYLYSPASMETFIFIPDGMPDAGKIARLKRSMYGLRQAPADWHNTINSFLESVGFHPLIKEPNIYIQRGEDDKIICKIGLYVDDLLVVGKRVHVDAIKAKISARYTTKDLGPVRTILGITVTRDRATRTLWLTQTAHVDKLVKAHSVELGERIVKTPCDPKLSLFPDPSDVELDSKQKTQYQKLVGMFLYLSLVTRPDIAYAAREAGRFSHCPTTKHWDAAMWLLRYLKGTRTLSLQYGGDIWKKHNDITNSDLVAYADSSYADEHGRQAVAGFAIFDRFGLINYGCKKMTGTSPSQSTMEAETVASAVAARSVIAHRYLRAELDGDTKILTPTILYGDNEAAVGEANGGTVSTKLKHIDVQFMYTQFQVKAGNILVKHIGTENMLADIFTKALDAGKHATFVQRLGLVPFDISLLR